MKSFLALTLLAALLCSSCSTLANRRDLYRPLKAHKQTAKKDTQPKPADATSSTSSH